jgi:bifunctional polynucleotide phosphatase/kinase
MSPTWHKDISNNGVLYYCQPSKKFNSEKVAGFDLDWTIIRPEIGKLFPISMDDWCFAYKMDKIHEYFKNGYKIVIFTNQKGSFQGKGNVSFEDFQERWFKILECLKVPAYIVASTQSDFNRKPSDRMWKFVEKNLNGDVKIDKNASFYVGDAAGRPNDHSECDIKFAINIGIKFMTPEEFFEGSTKFPFETLKSKLLGFNPKKYMEGISNIEKINHNSWHLIKEGLTEPTLRVIVMVGSPASGKTSLTHQLLQVDKNRKWHIYSLDLEGTKKKLKTKLSKMLSETSDGAIIDATNATIDTREEWIQTVKAVDPKIDVWCVYVNVPKDLTFHLNKLRGIRKEIDPEYYSKNVPTVAINAYWKKFQAPTTEENFGKIIEFDFEPIFKNKEEKKQFMTWL